MRRHLVKHDVVAAGAQFLANFHRTIKQTMQQGQHLQIFFVRIYQELGLDANPLIRYREERQLRLHQQDEEKRRLKEQKQRQAREQEQERLKNVGKEFTAGQFISCVDFISLCHQHDIPIPPRTHGTLLRAVRQLSLNQINYSRMKGKRSPKLDGCFLLIKTLRAKLTAK